MAPSTPPPAGKDSAPDPKDSLMRVEVSLVRELATLLDDTRLTEIEVTDGARSIRVARAVMAAPLPAITPDVVAPAPAKPAPLPVSAPESAAPQDDPGAVKSPMVGTVYLSAEPGSAPFISAGQQVAAGDTLLIIEAMKVMNPITAPRGGTVRTILVKNEQPVEFDQPLVIIE